MGTHHAAAFSAIKGVEIVGAVDLRADVLETFCTKHNINKQFATLDDALAWNSFDAACVVTPDNAHHTPTLQLLEAGKHVLCEKPLAPNHTQAAEMATAADQADVVTMVNLTYRRSAALQKAHELVAAGQLGQIKHVEAAYLQSWLSQDAWGEWSTTPTWLWRLSSAHGSLGVLGDVGVHLLDFAWHASGQRVKQVQCQLQTFTKAPGDRIGEYHLDANDSFVMNAVLANGALGIFHATRYATGRHNCIRLCVYGEKGGLEIDYVNTPFTRDVLRVCLNEDIKTATWHEVDLAPVPTVMEDFAATVLAGQRHGNPDFSHGRDLQEVMDQAFQSHQQGKTQVISSF